MYTIYSKPGCSFCVRAKQLLDILGEEFEEHDILVGNNLDILTEKLGYAPKTVPQIWDGEKYIGGYNELSIYIK